PTTDIYTLSLHDALPILSISDTPTKCQLCVETSPVKVVPSHPKYFVGGGAYIFDIFSKYDKLLFNLSKQLFILSEVTHSLGGIRSEEHTSELQSRENLVC